MSRINAPRGTADTLPADSWKWQAVEAIARDVATVYHFAEIRTPIYEYSELFHRGVGETTDIVSKETFTFSDRGGDSITLRPEGTAGKNFFTSVRISATNAPKKAACASTTSSASKPSASPSRSRMSNVSSCNWISIADAE